MQLLALSLEVEGVGPGVFGRVAEVEGVGIECGVLFVNVEEDDDRGGVITGVDGAAGAADD